MRESSIRGGGILASTRGRVFLQSVIQLLGKGISGIGALLLLSITTRYLGPNGFGTYILITSYLSLFYVVTDLGSQSIAVREMARDSETAPTVASQLLALKVGLSVIALAAAMVIVVATPFAPFHAHGVVAAFLLAGLALFSVAPLATGGAIFQTRLRMRIPATADVISRFATLALAIGLAVTVIPPLPSAWGGRLGSILLAGTVGSWLGAGIVYVGARRIVEFHLSFQWRVVLPMIRDALPLAVILILGMVHYRIDIVILTAMTNMSTVGQYGVATKLLDVALAISAIFMGLVFPVLSRRVAGDRALLQRAFQKALELLLIAGVGAAVFVTFLAPFIVRVVAPATLHQAELPVAVIAWSIPITFVNMLFAHMVVAGNRQLAAVPVTLGAILVNVVLNVIFIPHLGAVAPALVTDVTEGLGAFGMGVIMVRYYGFLPSISTPARIVLSAGIAALVLFVLQPVGVAVATLGGILAYAGALLVSRAVGIDDIRATLHGEQAAG